MVFFFFKQKTAYERRISDWSSDVCSSDLDQGDVAIIGRVERRLAIRRDGADGKARVLHDMLDFQRDENLVFYDQNLFAHSNVQATGGVKCANRRAVPQGAEIFSGAVGRHAGPRSEEHTSELQSLMRIS